MVTNPLYFTRDKCIQFNKMDCQKIHIGTEKASGFSKKLFRKLLCGWVMCGII